MNRADMIDRLRSGMPNVILMRDAAKEIESLARELDWAIRGSRQHVADTLAAASAAAIKANDVERAKRFADAQACVAEMFSDVKL